MVRRVASSPEFGCEITFKDRRVRDKQKKIRGHVSNSGGILVISVTGVFSYYKTWGRGLCSWEESRRWYIG